MLISKDVVFNETMTGLPPTSETDLIDFLHLDYFASTESKSVDLPVTEPPELPPVSEEPLSQIGSPSRIPQSLPSPSLLPLRRSTQSRQPPVQLDEYFLNLAMSQEISHQPQPDSLTDDITLEEVVHHPAWLSAMKEEIKSIKENST